MVRTRDDLLVLDSQQFEKIILLVEDDATHAQMLEFVLHSESPYRVISFASGSEILQHMDEVKSYQPDLFLLDYKLPAMSGLDLYDHLRSIDDFAQTPVLMITASLSNALEEAAVQRQLSLIYKPFDIDDLLTTIQHTLVTDNNI
jgi:CheY-like chemotaxis protein